MDRVLRRLAEARPFHVPPRPQRSARPTRRLILLPAGALAAAVAVVAAFTLAGGEPPAGDSSVVPVGAKDARQVLLAAAAQAETAQTGGGRYWLHKFEQGSVYDVGGYKVMGRYAMETWIPLSTADPYISCSRFLGFKPATDADRVAWQRAGSPTTVDTAKQPGRRLTVEPGTRSCKDRPGGELFNIGGGDYTLAEIEALPTDPARLRDAVGSRIPDVDPETLFIAATDILIRVPARPALRAAAYRMLAGLPGIGFVEGVTDQLGRTGNGVEHTFRNLDGVSWRTRLVIDPKTGQTLAHELRDSVTGEGGGYEAVDSSAPTDQSPPSA